MNSKHSKAVRKTLLVNNTFAKGLPKGYVHSDFSDMLGCTLTNYICLLALSLKRSPLLISETSCSYFKTC